ncbi:DUF1259 domain-containing protein [Alkalicoccobacillus gibsonii]|uniref:DUF1259 domain-containing protein n=1 Tax=Alkalicoccobacillus gibsonii TaxID=79881 RepID=UPI003F7C969B
MNSLCQQCAWILKGKGSEENGYCSISIPRSIKATIQGRPAQAPIRAGVTFESFDQQGNALNLGEIVLKQEEIQPFIHVLITHGIQLSALHNHWIYDDPTLFYVHFQSVEPPLTFCTKVAEALKQIVV